MTLKTIKVERNDRLRKKEIAHEFQPARGEKPPGQATLTAIYERRNKAMSDWRIARVILRTVIALCKAMLRIIGNNEAAQKHCDPTEEPDCELPSNFSE